jgi:uncharacterized protein (UPF0335 family)
MAEGVNLTKVKKAISSAFKKVVQFKEERAAINEEMGALRQALAAQGIPKPAFDMAVRYASWDEDKRKGFDVAYSLAREAIGMPFNAQGDLFIPGDDEDEEEADEARREDAGQPPMFA